MFQPVREESFNETDPPFVKKVIFCLYAAAHQSKNERRATILSVNTNQVAQIQYPIVHWAY